MQANKLDITPISGRWEAFISEVIIDPLPGVDQALVIVGSDMRGTVFGLYDVSEQMGVSPWWWWADVAVRERGGVWALGGRKVQGPPSVKYRGVFINDEQPALTNWIKCVHLFFSSLCLTSIGSGRADGKIVRITNLESTDRDIIITSTPVSLSCCSG